MKLTFPLFIGSTSALGVGLLAVLSAAFPPSPSTREQLKADWLDGLSAATPLALEKGEGQGVRVNLPLSLLAGRGARGEGSFSAEVSVYSRKYHGRKTASGERYDHHQKGPTFTAATTRRKGSLNPSRPFGTLLRLTADDGRQVTIRLTDTGSHRPKLADDWFDLPPAAWRTLYPSATPGRVTLTAQVINP